MSTQASPGIYEMQWRPYAMKRVLLTLMLLGMAALVRPASAADTVYYYYTNTLQSAAAITDAHGNVVERTYYAPYGRVLNRPMRDGPGYTDHEEDPATGLVYMQQRYYDAQSGRFLSTDPVLPTDDGANFNRYWYAGDNPYRYTDPDGRCPWCVGAVIGGGLEVLVQAFNPEDRAAYSAAGRALVHGDFGGVLRDAGPQLAKVAISAAAGAVGAGIAGKVGEVADAMSQSANLSVTGKVTVGALVRIGGNAAAGAALGASAKVGENAATGQPLTAGVGRAAAFTAGGGALGAGAEFGATGGAQRIANATGAFIGDSSGRLAQPGVVSAGAQRLGETAAEATGHSAEISQAACDSAKRKNGGC